MFESMVGGGSGSQKMHCRECGKTYPMGKVYCSECGSLLMEIGSDTMGAERNQAIFSAPATNQIPSSGWGMGQTVVQNTAQHTGQGLSFSVKSGGVERNTSNTVRDNANNNKEAAEGYANWKRLLEWLSNGFRKISDIVRDNNR